MKRFLFLVFISCFFSVQAQYTIDYQKAPANPIPFKYTLNHHQLQGNLKLRTTKKTLGYTETYNEKGNLVSRISSFADEKYFYNTTGNIVKYDMVGSIGTIITNKDGFITELSWEDGSGSKYSYNTKGLHSKELTSDNKLKALFDYDASGRIIRTEKFDTEGKLSSTTKFQYETDGEFIKVIRSNDDGKSKTSEIIFYDKYGNLIVDKKDQISYDAQGNILYQVLTKRALVEKFEYEYFKTEDIKQLGCVEGNCKDSFGKQVDENGTYIGFYENSAKQGYGKFVWDAGVAYFGNWQNNQMTGYAILKFPSGETQSGMFKNGKLHGFGFKFLADKTQEYGKYEDGKLITKFELYPNATDKNCAIGDCKNGYGQFIYEDGSNFVGFFENGNQVLGSWFGAEGVSYHGQFNSNKFNGFGLYVYKNGETHAGQFVNGKKEGKGCLMTLDDQHYTAGLWKNDQLVKEYLKN